MRFKLHEIRIARTAGIQYMGVHAIRVLVATKCKGTLNL